MRCGRDMGDRKLTITLPAAVVRQLKAASAARETTIRALLLEALARAGYAVAPEDIRDRRRRRDSVHRPQVQAKAP